jgi:hypothetical protein
MQLAFLYYYPINGNKLPYTHDWGTNLITIGGNGIFRTIVITKRLDETTKRHEVLCYNFVNGVINEENDVWFVTNPNLLSIEIVNLPLDFVIKSSSFNIIELEE